MIDAGGDPLQWPNSLSSLRSDGAFLLLVPPWSKPLDFNFYPHVHRRSLRVEAKRWHKLSGELDVESVESLFPIVSNLVYQSQWLRPLDVESATGSPGAWQFIDWTLETAG